MKHTDRMIAAWIWEVLTPLIQDYQDLLTLKDLEDPEDTEDEDQLTLEESRVRIPLMLSLTGRLLLEDLLESGELPELREILALDCAYTALEGLKRLRHNLSREHDIPVVRVEGLDISRRKDA